MPDQRLFICDFRAYPQHDTATARCFGITVSCALTGLNGAAGITLDDLLPWNALPDKPIWFYTHTGVQTDPWVKIASIDYLVPTLDPSDIAALAAFHKTQAGNFTRDQWVFAETADDESPRLSHYLATTSTELPPLNYGLKQAFCFRVAKADLQGAADLCAFVLPSDPGANQPTPADSRFELLAAPFKQLGADLCRSNSLPAAPPPLAVAPSEYFSPTSLVGNLNAKSAGGQTLYGENWYAALGENVCALIDGGRLFLDACPANEPGGLSAALCLTRDVAGLGIGPEPDQAADKCLAGDDSLFALVSHGQPGVHAAWLALRDWQFNTFSDPASGPQNWLDFLGGLKACPKLPEKIAGLTAPDLSRLITDLSSPELLHECILAQWKEAGAPPAMRDELKRVCDSAQTAPADDQSKPIVPSIRLSLQRGIARALVAKARSIADQNPANLAAGIADAYADFLQQRLSPPATPNDDKPWPFVDLQFSNDLKKNLGDLTKAAAGLFKPSDAQIAQTEQPHGLTIQVDRIQEKPDDDADYLRSISGFIVLMRRTDAPTKKWRWLNLCRARAGATELALPLVCPNRLTHDGDDRAIPFLTYDNQPLVAASPAIPDGARTQVSPLVAGAGYGARPELFVDITNPNGAFRIPGLIYGKDYEVCIFARANSGILPADLVDATSGHPAVPKIDISTDFPAGVRVPYSYRRRVPVGIWDIAPAPDGTPGALPVIPETLNPLAWEILQEQTDQNIARRAARPPLILLAPKSGTAAGSHRAWFRKPSTGLKNWDRWVADDASRKAERIDLRAAVQRQHDLSKNTEPLQPFDPAVADFVRVRLKALHEGAGHSSTLIVAATEKFEILFESSAQPGLTASPAGCVVRTPSGSVFEVLVDSLVTAGDFQKRFQTEAFGTPENVAHGADNFVVMASHRLLVEVAKKLDIVPADLMKAFSLVSETGRLTAWLTPASGGANFSSNLRYADKAILRTQGWRWQGTRLPALPEPAELNMPPAPGSTAEHCGALWDTWGFAHLDDFAGPSQSVDLWRQPFAADKPRELFSWNLGSSPRAIYRRVTLTLRSRYASLPGYDREVRVADNDLGPWRRAVVKARPRNRLQKPSLKALVPVTRPRDDLDPKSRPAILAIFRGSWYEEAGLAETLGARIAIVDSQNGNHFLEAGFDPIRSVAKLGQITSNPPQSAGELKTIRGPVAHTLDSATTDPLVLNSSFLISLPDSLGGTPISSDNWFFAKLEFRRQLRAPLVDGGEVDSLASEWTAPEWAQFVPGTDIAFKKPSPVVFTSEGKPGASPAELLPGGDRTLCALLVTRLIPDSLDPGNDSEAYICTLIPSPSNPDWLRVDGGKPPGGPLRVRALEIFTRDPQSFLLLAEQNLNLQKEFWPLLFNAASTVEEAREVRDDVLGVITRVSNAVEATMS